MNKQKAPTTVYQLLDLVRRRPAMYFGYHTPTHLNSFIGGFFFRDWCVGHTPTESPDFGSFHDWVAQKLGYSDSVRGWANMISEQRKDQEEALWLFFQLLDEFRGLQPRILASIEYNPTLQPDPRRYNLSGKRSSNARKTAKARPTRLTIEEVLPDRQWVCLFAWQGNVILDRTGADTVAAALQAAQQIFGVDHDTWTIMQ